jgi:D-3-phosphoglycerate dehydrogenase
MADANTVKVTCLGYVFVPAAQDIIRSIAPQGFDLRFAEHPRPEHEAWLTDSDFVFIVSPMTEAMMRKAPKLRLIQKWGIGVDKIDLEAAEALGIPVAITAGANAASVSEHTMMHMLALSRRLPLADRAMREGRWVVGDIRPQARQLLKKTVGILGFGNIGRAVAQRLQGFGVRVIYYDIKGPFEDIAKPLNATFVDMDTLLAQSDILTIHIPGGGNNRYLFNKATFAKMQPGAALINAARGDIVEESALIAALESGHLSGAGLDVYESEPRGETPLAKFDNVVMTPHSAGSVMDNVAPMAQHGLENMLRVLRGEPIPDADAVVKPTNPRQI